jgi:hypothetical protein
LSLFSILGFTRWLNKVTEKSDPKIELPKAIVALVKVSQSSIHNSKMSCQTPSHTATTQKKSAFSFSRTPTESNSHSSHRMHKESYAQEYLKAVPIPEAKLAS